MPDKSFVLSDVLVSGLRVVFCGTAAGKASAAAKAYYAKPGNKFWRVLHEAGFTTLGRALLPEEYHRLPEFGLGLTDLCKKVSGNDDELSQSDFDAGELRRKIELYQPAVLALTSKKSGQMFFGEDVEFGWQPSPIGSTRIYILPSTSGAANGSWKSHGHHWQSLANAVSEKL